MADIKDAAELTKEEALAELALLKEDVEFDSDFDEKTSLSKLRGLVQEGRDALKDKTPPRLSQTPAKKTTHSNPGDYLRQYQFRANTVLGSPQSDPPPESKAAKMKALLLKQPRLRFIITRRDGESKKITQSCTLNGYHLELPKGKWIELPEQICEHLAESAGQTNEAFDRIEQQHGYDRVKEGGKVADVLG